MNEQEKLYTGVSRAAWGCLFLYLDVNLGPVNILPDFAAYLLFLSAISYLKEEVRDFALLRPLGILLSGWCVLEWVLDCLKIELPAYFAVISLVITVVTLYFGFQFFTDFALLAERYQAEGDDLDRYLRRLRTVQTVLTTAVALPVWKYAVGTNWEGWLVVLFGAAVVVTVVGLMAALFSLRKLFAE